MKKRIISRTAGKGKTKKSAKPKAGGKTKPKSKAKPKRKAKRRRVSTPLVFISHRYKDKNIADVISTFLRDKSGNRVKVFQSSGTNTKAPDIGKNLNQELMKNLWTASAVILVYTTPDQDWSYVMWECGVATHPDSPDTRIILFQCSNQTPPMFVEQVRVDIQNLGTVLKFVKEFMTSPQFFPNHGRAMSRFQENDPAVAQAAQELYEKLQKVAPADDTAAEEWPALPFLRLEISPEQAAAIRKGANKSTVASKIFKKSLITEVDRVALQLFNVPSLSPPKPIEDLIGKSTKKNRTAWWGAMISQLTAGVMWKFPKMIWEFMPDAENNMNYAPVLTRVRRSPNQGMQFDIYFCRFPASAKKSKPLGEQDVA